MSIATAATRVEKRRLAQLVERQAQWMFLGGKSDAGRDGGSGDEGATGRDTLEDEFLDSAIAGSAIALKVRMGILEHKWGRGGSGLSFLSCQLGSNVCSR